MLIKPSMVAQAASPAALSRLRQEDQQFQSKQQDPEPRTQNKGLERELLSSYEKDTTILAEVLGSVQSTHIR